MKANHTRNDHLFRQAAIIVVVISRQNCKQRQKRLKQKQRRQIQKTLGAIELLLVPMLVLEHAQGHLGQDNHDNQEHANSRADKDAVTATAAKRGNNSRRSSHANQAEMLRLPRWMHGIACAEERGRAKEAAHTQRHTHSERERHTGTVLATSGVLPSATTLDSGRMLQRTGGNNQHI
ncbi:unnamed protein product [Ceratitis capitata]|uniref:(Mediterranean fruit fly) hypothetical protein n=1 Tax=Ceratitis capitata TaxID=7213 RepID=A0A811U8T1_CERCA|nr:unnamed protein product [Ceratitis capitata]